MATNAVIRLDSSRPYSEIRGERCVDDPHYRVVSMQGRMVGKKNVMLPFDANGELVPDDGKREPYDGMNVEGKPVKHFPLYTDDMRALVERLTKKAREKQVDPDAPDDDEQQPDGTEALGGDPADEVNLVSWLKGEARYTPQVLRKAVKDRYNVVHQTIPPMVVSLVDDERLVPREQVCKELAKFLPA